MFVEYETHRAAALARRKLVPGKVFLFGVEVGQVDWAEPEPEVDEEQMKHIKILYVRHLNMATTEQTLMTCFSQLSNGQVDRVRKPKDYAFIHFTSREAAELAMSRCNSLYMDGQKVDVMWAKPPDKDSIVKKLDRQATFTQPTITPQNWSPDQILLAVCKTNNWGEPIYRLNCAREPSSGVTLYHYNVILPHYPALYPDNVFQVQKWMMTDLGAKNLAAQHILSSLGLMRPSPLPSPAPTLQPDRSRVASVQSWANVFTLVTPTNNQLFKSSNTNL